MPDALLVEQDGYSLCRTLCADATSKSEFDLMYAKQFATTEIARVPELLVTSTHRLQERRAARGSVEMPSVRIGVIGADRELGPARTPVL